jgi:hypothetical protein
MRTVSEVTGPGHHSPLARVDPFGRAECVSGVPAGHQIRYAIAALLRSTALVGLCAGAAATCGRPTEPIRPQLLRTLTVSDRAVLRDSGLLVVFAVPQDTTVIPPPHFRLQVELTTTSGDIESFNLTPIICDEFTLSCHHIGVVMKEGHHIRETFSLLNAIPARVWWVGFGGELAGVYVFEPDNVPEAVSKLTSYPAVKSAARNHAGADPPPPKWTLDGGLPLDFRPVISRDGVVQARPNDTVTVKYHQPDSTIIELRLVVPEP